MAGNIIFLSHWHGGDLPAILDLDTEICKEELLLTFVFEIEESQTL